MPPDTNKPGVTGGVTEACLFNDHNMCNNLRCGCDCHVKAAQARGDNGHIVVQARETGPEKSCPKCKAKRPNHEVYCRIDGERLSSLACNICGAGREPEDLFCHQCGSPADAIGQVKLPQVVNIPTVPEVSDAEAQRVLASIQEELSNVQVPETDSKHAQVVVEQPAGTQGSFKLVSRPNPNKVRVPAGGNRQQAPALAKASPASPRKGFKLPIKPS